MVMKLRGFKPELNAVSDAVARPTTPYVEMSFGMGTGWLSRDQHDAACGQHLLQMAHSQDRALLPAADRGRVGVRLPCGTTTAYSFGDDPAMLDDYAWHDGNSNFKYQKVGTKKPNPWGCTICTATSANGRPTSSSRTFTGRSRIWFPTRSAMANPLPSHRSWRFVDGQAGETPQRTAHCLYTRLEVSGSATAEGIWYHTDAQFLGFRVVRH